MFTRLIRAIFDSEKPVTATGVEDILTGVEDKSRMITKIFKQHREEMLALVGKDFARRTYNRYEAALRNVQEFKTCIAGRLI